jgi:hypothetical protein
MGRLLLLMLPLMPLMLLLPLLRGGGRAKRDWVGRHKRALCFGRAFTSPCSLLV